MKREYLLKVIDKNFWVLSKDEISEQIDKIKSSLPDSVKTSLKTQNMVLASDGKKLFHPYFSEEISNIKQRILRETDCPFPNPLRMEVLFDQSLLLISIYYRYPEAMYDNVMAELLRLVLKEKILLA